MHFRPCQASKHLWQIFFAKLVTDKNSELFSEKYFVIHLWKGPKYTSETIYLDYISNCVYGNNSYTVFACHGIQLFCLLKWCGRRLYLVFCHLILINLFHSCVAFHIGTNHLFCIANQRTSFYMKSNSGLKWVCHISFSKLHFKFYILSKI